MFSSAWLPKNIRTASVGWIIRRGTSRLADMTRPSRASNTRPLLNGWGKSRCSIAASAPAGESRRLASAKLLARDMESFSIAKPSIVKELRLPDFAHSDRMAWPPRRVTRPFIHPAGLDHCAGAWTSNGAEPAADNSCGAAAGHPPLLATSSIVVRPATMPCPGARQGNEAAL